MVVVRLRCARKEEGEAGLLKSIRGFSSELGTQRFYDVHYINSVTDY